MKHLKILLTAAFLFFFALSSVPSADALEWENMTENEKLDNLRLELEVSDNRADQLAAILSEHQVKLDNHRTVIDNLRTVAENYRLELLFSRSTEAALQSRLNDANARLDAYRARIETLENRPLDNDEAMLNDLLSLVARVAVLENRPDLLERVLILENAPHDSMTDEDKVWVATLVADAKAELKNGTSEPTPAEPANMTSYYFAMAGLISLCVIQAYPHLAAKVRKKIKLVPVVGSVFEHPGNTRVEEPLPKGEEIKGEA